MTPQSTKLDGRNLPAYVQSVMHDRINLVCRDEELIKALQDTGLQLSAPQSGSRYEIVAKGHDETARVFGVLRDAGVAFSAGREWSPEELFQYYRDDIGLISGSFVCIFWRGRDNAWVADR